MYTRKAYVQVAAILNLAKFSRAQSGEVMLSRDSLVEDFVRLFSDNPSFNADLFRQAATGRLS